MGETSARWAEDYLRRARGEYVGPIELLRRSDLGAAIVEDFERVARRTLVGAACVRYKNRLGVAAIEGPAASARLAADKKVARRVTNVYWNLWGDYIRRFPVVVVEVADLWDAPGDWNDLLELGWDDEEARAEAGTIDWKEWVRATTRLIELRRASVIETAISIGEYRSGARLARSLEDELAGLSRIAEIIESVRVG